MHYNFSDLKTQPLLDEGGPLFLCDVTIDPFVWFEKNKNSFELALHEVGGVVLRNFGIDSVSHFNRVAQCIEPNLLEYVYRSTPRTKVGGRIYTTTEYPANLSIPMHNENAYTNQWPKKIMFYCAVPPGAGGETPVADSRRVLKRIPEQVVKLFEEHGVMTVRHYYDHVDLNWREVFQTESRAEVEEYCKKNNIQYTWMSDQNGLELQTKQISQATLLHPETKEKVWFNQAHLFHVSQLGKEQSEGLIQALSKDKVPRNSFYGDGAPIGEEVIRIINEAYEAEKYKFPWQSGDLMILDNRLMAHGREPFSGERKILAAMA